jgi:ankyrin repeat protein
MTFEDLIKSFTTHGLRVEDVRRYLDAGGDINHRDQKMDWSLLHFAAEDCNSEVIRLLVARGANLAAKDWNGWTPLHLAVDSDADTASQGGWRATGLPTVQTLLELGADEKVKTADGATPRDLAIDYGQENLYDSLIHGRNPD